MSDLNPGFPIDPEIGENFRRDGHAVVRGLLDPGEAESWRQIIEPLARSHAWDKRPIEERDTYGKAFLQTLNLWEHSPEVARFSCAGRFASVAAALLGCRSVRMYHDQALCKEAGGGATPWHQDQNYWPLDGPTTVTMWMPLVDVPTDVGSMHFVSGAHLLGDLAGGNISDASESSFAQLIADKGWTPTTHGAMTAGDATFHAGWMLHSAEANPTDLFRTVMTVIYVNADTTINESIAAEQRLDHELWLGGATPGGPINSPKNPVLWPVPE